MPTLGLADKAYLAARIVALRDIHPVLTSDLAFPLPQSTVVDFQCPETIVQWAYWGVMLCHPSREEFIADTAHVKSDSTNQRMDRRAKELGFNGGFAEYQRFIRSVDDCANDRGYGRYRNLCVPSAYLNQLRKARPELAPLLDSDEWKAGETVYRQFSPYMIDGIVRSKLEPEQAKVRFIVRSGFLYYVFGPGPEDWDGCLNTFEQGADPKTPALQQAQKLARAMQADISRYGPPQAD